MEEKRRLPSDKENSIQVEEISSSVVTEIQKDEDGFLVGLETMVPANVPIAEEDYPEFKKDGQFDALLVYHENDQEKARYCIDRLCSQNHLSGRRIRIATLEQRKGGKNEIERLEYYCKKSTFLMMLLTENFCDDDNWMRFYQNTIIMESILNREKKWCAIPIHTEYWRKPVRYKVPFALQGIRGICLTDNAWDEGVINMIQQKEPILLDREWKQEREFKTWLMREQGIRLKKWKREKENLKKEREQIQQKTAECDSDTMEYDTQPTLHLNNPGFQTQRNIGSTREQCPPGVPRQAWDYDSNNSVPQNQFTGPYSQGGATSVPNPFPGGPGPSPEQVMQLQTLMQMYPNMLQVQAPMNFSINARVINFGNNSQTMIQTPMEDDIDEEDF